MKYYKADCRHNTHQPERMHDFIIIEIGHNEWETPESGEPTNKPEKMPHHPGEFGPAIFYDKNNNKIQPGDLIYIQRHVSHGSHEHISGKLLKINSRGVTIEEADTMQIKFVPLHIKRI